MIVREHLFEHPVLRVADKCFGYAEEANLAGVALPLHFRDEIFQAVRIVLRTHSVQVIDVDVIRTERPEALFQVLREPFGRQQRLAKTRADLGGDHDLVATSPDGLPHRGLGAVDTRRVDEVDAEVHRPPDDARRVAFVVTGPSSEPAMAAAAEPRNAHFEAGAAQPNGLHCSFALDPLLPASRASCNRHICRCPSTRRPNRNRKSPCAGDCSGSAPTNAP